MSPKQTKDDNFVSDEQVQELMQSLPNVTLRQPFLRLVNYQDFWYDSHTNMFKNVLTFQKYFLARDTDIFITGFPKTGTTWLKSLLYATVNNTNFPIHQTPLLFHHPQELVYNLESDVYNDAFAYPGPQHLDELPSPRLLSTHVGYVSLPESIKTSKCRILYICRNPLDTIVSYYHFSVQFLKNYTKGEKPETNNFEDVFEDFCEGKVIFGPFFEHVIGYWKMSLERPDKVLFIKYEDLKDEPTHQLKRIGEFIGMPFSSQDEIKQIVELCDIKNMKEVNKSGVINKYFEKKSYFRKGEVGDWTNHCTPPMVERIQKLTHEKLEGSGLSFKFLP